MTPGASGIAPFSAGTWDQPKTGPLLASKGKPCGSPESGRLQSKALPSQQSLDQTRGTQQTRSSDAVSHPVNPSEWRAPSLVAMAPDTRSLKRRFQVSQCYWAEGYLHTNLGVTSPFFPGILLSRKPPKTLGKWRLAFEKNDG